ncbi:recombinase family protein [Chryseobacterium wangxinyae]|uniref:recombinase family protein n=1 Tax=Chryseobacterium sp. CY353 TaxID=2997334 RepID=UPI00226E2C21|nr:recombinase family protein [Chryseobacterium sp. CY353]MCY0971040.1 recombinase family protein [Chryseobacterium sp. CY353]
MTKYIGYIRVSTKHQNNSGLGQLAQKAMIKNFLKKDDLLIAEYEEVESGKKDDRPELLKALEHCKKENAILLIGKLDRLSRNVGFIYLLKDSKVKFVCCDMPEATDVTIGIMAVLAQDERERTSQRTKAALAELKAKGVQLGSPCNLNSEARQSGTKALIQKARNNPNNKLATALIVPLRESGLSYQKIADKLNESGFKTSTGKEFSNAQVLLLYDRYINIKLESDHK